MWRKDSQLAYIFHYATFIFDKIINILLTPSLEQPLSSPTLAVVTIHRGPVKISAETKMLRGATYLTDSPEIAKRSGFFFHFPRAGNQRRDMSDMDKAVWKTACIAE